LQSRFFGSCPIGALKQLRNEARAAAGHAGDRRFDSKNPIMALFLDFYGYIRV
jgi:hypothetical protein